MKQKKRELLRKSDSETEAVNTDETQTDETPAVDTSEEFNKALEDLNQTVLDKAKKKKEEEPEEEPEEEEPEDEAQEGLETGKKKAKKSLVEEVAGGDPEAEAAMDVSPFLKSFVEKVGEMFDSMSAEISELKKSLAEANEVLDAQSKVLLAEGEMLKSQLNADPASEGEPQPRKSVMVLERFTKSKDGDNENLTVAQAQTKVLELAKSGVLTPTQVSVIEGRLNKGLPLPEFFLSKINASKEA